MVRKVNAAKNWTGHEDNNYVPIDSKDLDIEALYELLSIRDPSQLDRNSDPIFAISVALNQYTHEAYPTHIPKYVERLKLMQNINEQAQALAETFEGSGEETYLEIEVNLAKGLRQEAPADHYALGSADIKVSQEISFFREFSTDYIRKFANLMKTALEEYPNSADAPKKGRPDKSALRKLIIELAMIYEDATGFEAYEGFSSDPITGEYDSAFFRFAWEVVYTFDPKAAKSNNAFGTQLRKALANNPIGWYTPEITRIDRAFDSDID